MGFFDRISEGLSRSRQKFTEQMNVLLDRGPNLDDDFWDDLEETLILADMGGSGRRRRLSKTFATKPRARRCPMPMPCSIA